MDMSMSMTTTTSGAATSTMDMSMASPTSMTSTTDTTMMGMDSMAMTFFTSTSTPLYSMSWMPDSIGQYAGTCIFLIVFALAFRALLAIRVNFFEFMAVVKHRRSGDLRYLSPSCKSNIRPWRMNEAVMLGSMDVLLAGIGYLLMIAVMTMNVGYFLSVLAGVFLGSFGFGRFMAHSGSH